MRNNMKKINRSISALLLIISISLPIIFFFIFQDFTSDDTYISIKYVDNILHHGSWSFNKGEPTYGTTSPLWVMLLTVYSKLGSDNLIQNARILNLIFSIAAIIIFYILSLCILKNKIFSSIATLFFASDPWFLRWASSGMESSFTIFLILAGMVPLVHSVSRSRYYIASVLFALAFLSRPECFLLLPALCFYILIQESPKNAVKSTALSILLFAAVCAPWFVYSKLVFNTIVPNTARKSYASIIASFMRIFKTLLSVYSAYLILIIGNIIIHTRSFKLKSIANNWEKIINTKKNMIILFWPFLLIIGYLYLKSIVMTRYFIMITPHIILFGMISFIIITEKINRERLKVALVIMVFCLISIQNVVFIKEKIHPIVRNFVNEYQSDFMKCAIWLKENTDSDAKILVGEIGILGYYSDRYLYDIQGLVTPEFLINREGIKRINYINTIKPDYAVFRVGRGEDFSYCTGIEAECRLLHQETVYGGGMTMNLNRETVIKIYELIWNK